MPGLDIHKAAMEGQTSLVASLLSEDPSLLNSRDVDGRTPLHWAATRHLSTVQLLLSQSPPPEVDLKDSQGWTALMIAVSAGQDDTVDLLMGAGADVKAANEKGITALHYAASKGRYDIGKLLVAKGADINARDKAQQLPLHRAATTGSVAFIKLLLNPPPGSPKPRLNGGDRMGNTPLHLAMDSAHAEAAVLLIEAGADRSRTNSDGETPEQLEGVGGREQRQAREYVVSRVGPAE